MGAIWVRIQDNEWSGSKMISLAGLCCYTSWQALPLLQVKCAAILCLKGTSISEAELFWCPLAVEQLEILGCSFHPTNLKAALKKKFCRMVVKEMMRWKSRRWWKEAFIKMDHFSVLFVFSVVSGDCYTDKMNNWLWETVLIWAFNYLFQAP